MQRTFYQYNLAAELAKKYSHSTYLVSPVNDPEHHLILIAFDSSLSFAFPRECENLLQKAQSIKKLRHPHLLPILDMGIEEEQPFVVRDYLPGGSLRNRLKQLSPRWLELQEALDIVLQVGEALAYAHEQNIFHGNIKPENILFDANGQALLTDFTLTTNTDTILRDQTSEEYPFCYMAPEQFSGTCDAHSDQYALGCLTYELITGKLPFGAQTLSSIIGQHNNIQPIPPSERVSRLPPSLEDALLKTLAKEPDERFSDFSLFLEVIRSAASPPLAFPFPRSTASHKSRTLSRPARPPKERAFLSSLHQLDVSADPPPGAPEEGVLQQSEGLIPSKENGDDLWLSKKIAEQERSDPSAAGFVDRELEPHESSTDKIDEMIVSLPMSDNRDRPLKRHTWHKSSKLLGLVFLCFVIIASGIYAALLPLRGASKPDLPVHPTQTMRQVLVVPVQNSIPFTVLATPTTPVQPIPQIPRPTPQITTIPTVIPTVIPPRSYEAEAPQNTLAGGAEIIECSECSGGYRVGFIGYGQRPNRPNLINGTLQFNGIYKNINGSYTLTLYCSNANSSGLDGYVSVNGGPAIVFNGPPTGSFTSFVSVDITVNLNAGNNTIKLYNSQAMAPDIDRIVV